MEKSEELTSYRFAVMEENIRDIREESKATRDEMRAGFKEIMAYLSGLDTKYDNRYVDVEIYREDKQRFKDMEKKVEKIDLRIASWSGSLIIVAFIAQQLFEKWKG